jgi:hypothetical protein
MNPDATPTELAERLLELSEKATPAEWRCSEPDHATQSSVVFSDGGRICEVAPKWNDCDSIANRDLIAAARNAIEPLCRAVIDGPRWCETDLDFEQIHDGIADASLSFLPALLGQAVKTCRQRGVFKSDAMMLLFIVRQIEALETSERNREKLRKFYANLVDENTGEVCGDTHAD